MKTPTLILIFVIALSRTGSAQITAQQLEAARANSEETIRFMHERMSEAQEEAETQRAAFPPLNAAATQQAAAIAAEARLNWLGREMIPWLINDERAPDGT